MKYPYKKKENGNGIKRNGSRKGLLEGFPVYINPGITYTRLK